MDIPLLLIRLPLAESPRCGEGKYSQTSPLPLHHNRVSRYWWSRAPIMTGLLLSVGTGAFVVQMPISFKSILPECRSQHHQHCHLSCVFVCVRVCACVCVYVVLMCCSSFRFCSAVVSEPPQQPYSEAIIPYCRLSFASLNALIPDKSGAIAT